MRRYRNRRYPCSHGYHHNTQINFDQPKRYGCLGFIGDIFMTAITGGLWLIWIFVREMRRR